MLKEIYSELYNNQKICTEKDNNNSNMRSRLASWSLYSTIVMVTAFLSAKVSGTRIKERVYHDIDTNEISACFRRLNGTTSIGCTSARGGNVGVLIYLDTMADIDKLSDVRFSPYIVLVNPAIFSSSLMTHLESTSQVTGVVLPSVSGGRWEGKVPPEGYSDDSLCPNSETSTSDKCNTENPWNIPGSGLMWKSYQFPIFYIQNTTTTDNLYTCYQAYNTLTTGMAWPLCSVQLSSNMHASRDSETCVRRSNMMNNLTPQKFCDPLNDVTLHYFVSSRNRTLENGDITETPPASVLAVTARLDTLNMFDKAELGFDSPTTGIVTLLAAAKMVSQKMATLSYRDGVSNIMFLLINGEAFENTGSSRLVYDMEHGDFPRALNFENTGTLANGTQAQATLNLTNIRSLIELGQLSNRFSNNLYMHTVNNPAGEVGQFEKFSRLNNLTTKQSKRTELPPSSAQTFLTSTPSLHTVFLSNFDTTYSNPVYHSVYDTALYHGYNHTLGPTQDIVSHLSKVAVVVAQTVTSLATDQEMEFTTDEVSDLINDLLHCYSVSANCSMFHEANSNIAGFSFPNHPFPQYVGVNPSPHTVFTKQVLQLLTGEKITREGKTDEVRKTPTEESEDVAAQKAACLANNSGQNIFTYIFLVGEGCYNGSSVICGSCYRTTVGQTQAGSPAFLEGVLDSYDWASGKYPTWTESVWKEISGRSFLQGDPTHDQLVLGIGVGVFLASLLCVWWVEKNAVLLFPQGGCEYRIGANIAT